MPSSMCGIHGVPMSETSIARLPPQSWPSHSQCGPLPLPLHAVGGIAQRAPEMFHGKRIQLRGAEVTGQHRTAEGDDVMQGQQPKLDDGEIAVAANQQRILLLAQRQPLPVNTLQQPARTISTAHRKHNPVFAGQAHQTIDIIQPLRFATGKTLLAAGDNRLFFYLMARFQQTLNAPLRRVLVNAVARRRDKMKLRHGNSLLNEKLIVYIMPLIRRLLQERRTAMTGYKDR
ncbi:hypothetical protein L1887_42672 [Cichorium endivia]|nr:hypothetical protein L1887_42672 [Cichorium endivia]